MNKFLFGTAAVALFAIGCPSPEAICQSGVDQACERAFECQSEAVKSSDAFKAGYGASVDECKTKLATASKCSEKKEDNDLCTGTDAGKTFNLGNASDCSDLRGEQSCADYLDATKLPEVCKQKCE